MRCIGMRTNLSHAIADMPRHIIWRQSWTVAGTGNAGSLQMSVIVAYLRKVTARESVQIHLTGEPCSVPLILYGRDILMVN